MRSFLFASFLLVGAAACSSESLDSQMTLKMVPSTGVASSDLEATFSVSGELDKPTVSATVFFARKERDELVYLAGDDAAYVDGRRIGSTLSFENGFVELPRKAPGEKYHFEVRRPNETVTADVVAAAPIELLAPAAETEVAFGSKLAVTWRAEADSSIQAQVSGRCLMSIDLLERESGSVVLDAERMPEAPPSSGPSTPGYDPSGATGCAGAGSVVLMRTREERPATTFAQTSTVAREMTRVSIQLKTP